MRRHDDDSLLAEIVEGGDRAGQSRQGVVKARGVTESAASGGPSRPCARAPQQQA